jgi:putative transposase
LASIEHLDIDFCAKALEEVINRFGTSEIFNTDQGAQFTSNAFTNVLKHHDIKISMGGAQAVQSMGYTVTIEF